LKRKYIGIHNKYLENSIIFVLGDVLNKAIPFFLLPVLTRYLTPEGYGIISIITALISVLVVFTGINVPGAINVSYFKLSKENLEIYIGNAIIVANIATLIMFVLIYLFSPYIVEKLLIEREWLFVAAALAFSQLMTTINLILWVVEKKSKPYALYQISQTLVTTAITLVLIIGFGFDWEGRILAISIGTVMFSMISVLFLLKRGYLSLRPSPVYLKELLKFGVPLIPHALSGWVRTGADRFILVFFLGSSSVGIYSAAYQIGLVVSILATAFHKVWNPYMLETLSSAPTKDSKIKIVKFTYLYFVSVVIFALIFSLSAKVFVPYVLGPQFFEASEYILYFSLAFAFQGMYFMISSYIFYAEKTHILAYVSTATAIIHLVLLYILVDVNGAVGAAQATLISFSLTFFMTWRLSNKVYPMPWSIRPWL